MSPRAVVRKQPVDSFARVSTCYAWCQAEGLQAVGNAALSGSPRSRRWYSLIIRRVEETRAPQVEGVTRVVVNGVAARYASIVQRYKRQL